MANTSDTYDSIFTGEEIDDGIEKIRNLDAQNVVKITGTPNDKDVVYYDAATQSWKTISLAALLASVGGTS